MERAPFAACHSALRLALYSDQVIAANRRLDLELLRLLGRGPSRIGYLASAPDPTRRFFNAKKDYYAQYGAIDLIYFEPESLVDQAALTACDAIHLSGGDTRGFLANLRSAGLIEPLRRCAMEGKPLIGTSAGAILMTPSIAVNALFEAGMPADLPEAAALGLVPFEFFPHVRTDPAYQPALVRYSRQNGGRPILACPDGAGVLVENGIARAIGAVTEICDGEIRPR